MMGPKNEAEDSLLSVTKNCETLMEETKTKPQETFELRLAQSRETFSITPPNKLSGSCLRVK